MRRKRRKRQKDNHKPLLSANRLAFCDPAPKAKAKSNDQQSNFRPEAAKHSASHMNATTEKKKKKKKQVINPVMRTYQPLHLKSGFSIITH